MLPTELPLAAAKSTGATKRLGRGLADIIEVSSSSQTKATHYTMVRTERIRPGRFQPRERISEPGLEELKASIQRSGVIEPIIVRPAAHETYELVAGERRWRASQALGLAEIPAIVKPLSDREALEYSIIENVQREELNPLEQAKGFQRLLEEFGYTQEQVAGSVGKDRTTVANLLRVLGLPEEVRAALGQGTITLGHAKALLGLADRARQVFVYQQVISQALSVRQTEKLVGAAEGRRLRRGLRKLDPNLAVLEDALRRRLGTKVRILPRKRGGRILIEYFSSEDLTRVLQATGALEDAGMSEPRASVGAHG